RCSGSPDTDVRRGPSRRLLPVVPNVASRRDDPAQRQHRGIRRQYDELATRRRERQSPIERAPEVGLQLDALTVEPAVGEPKRKLRRTPSGGDELLESTRQRLEIDVPDPGDVASVRDRVVERDESERRRSA